MTRENRLILLVALTYCLYGAGIYFSQGSFIFPFPLNDAVIFIVLAQFSYWKRNDRLLALNLFLIGVLAILKSHYFWEILLSAERLRTYYETSWSDLLTLTFYVAVAVFATLTSIRQRNTISTLALISFLSFYVFATINNVVLHFLVAYAILLMSNLIAKKERYYPIWVLFFMLELFKAFHLGL